jgi:hypothetical protein
MITKRRILMAFSQSQIIASPSEDQNPSFAFSDWTAGRVVTIAKTSPEKRSKVSQRIVKKNFFMRVL